MSSRSRYYNELVWASHGEQLRADLNATLTKLSGLHTQLGTGQRQMGLWGNQMKALGTTLRYAFAGSIVYGVATAITSLGEFEAKLGEIDAVAADVQGGNLVSLGDRLEDLGTRALITSNKYGIAVSNIQDFQRAFFSAGFTQQATRNIDQAQKWADTLAQVQLFAEGADPTKLGTGIAGLIANTGGRANPGAAAGRFRDLIYGVLKYSNVFRGEDISRDIGRLSAAGPALNMTPEQIFAIYGSAGAAGGSGAVIGRGIAQLLTASLANPKSKDQKMAFAQLGLPTTPGQLRQLGGMEILRRLLEGIGPISPSGARGLRSEDLTDEEALAGSGVGGNRIDLLYKAIGRMESVRQVLNLAATGGIESIEAFERRIREAEKNHQGAQAAEIANNRRWYQQMNEAQKNLRTSLARGVEPALEDFGNAVKDASDFVVKHPRESAAVVGGGLAVATIMKIITGAGIGNILTRIPGINRIPGIGRAGQLGPAMLVGSGVGAFASTGTGTRADPIWVVIDPLSWFFPGAPNNSQNQLPGGGPGPGIAKPPIVPLWARRVGGIGGPIAAAAFAGYEVQDWLRHLGRGNNPLVEDVLRHGNVRADSTWGKRNPRVRALFAQYAKGAFTKHGFEERLERLAMQGVNIPGSADEALRRTAQADRRGRHAPPVSVKGEAQVTVVLQPSEALKRTIKGQKLGATKIPLGSGNIPQHRGKKEVTPGAGAGASGR